MRIGYIVALLTLTVPMACAATDDSESEGPSGVVQSTWKPNQCKHAEPHDVLIADLFAASLAADFSLTQLYNDGGNVAGPAEMPAPVAATVADINDVEEAREAVITALDNGVTGLPEYSVESYVVVHEGGCPDFEAWAGDETAVTDLDLYDDITIAANPDSWDETIKQFGKECPLVKRMDQKNSIDPGGDGSTNRVTRATLARQGVTANAWGLCPAGVPTGTYCMLSYATGTYYAGTRWCQPYRGYKRCLLK